MDFKKILRIFVVILLCYVVFKFIKTPLLLADEYYIVDFENGKSLTKTEENDLIKTLNSDVYNIKENDNVTITKIAYQEPFRHESCCYIFFKVNNIDKKLPFTLINITENYKEYVSEHVCPTTSICKKFKLVRNTVSKYYNWLENNEKNINYEKLQEPYTTEAKDHDLEQNYEIVSGENLVGHIIDITDKYLKIQEKSGNIKLVKIDINSTNFWNYRSKESITLYKVNIGDYFLNNMIIRNITGDEWIEECLKNICSEITPPLFVPTKILNIENKNEYYVVTIEMEDKCSDYFEKKYENRNKCELQFIINNKTEYSSKKVSINNLQDITNNTIFTISLDKESIENDYPIITKIDLHL